MTAYELFDRVYKHYTGQFMGNLRYSSSNNYKDYAINSFNELLNEYSIDTSSSTAVILSYDANKKLLNAEQLRDTKLLAGYWLCCYDGHTGDWRLTHYYNRDEAKASYKRLYSKYFRYSDWFHIQLVREVI
jgi:hypothetical protein